MVVRKTCGIVLITLAVAGAMAQEPGQVVLEKVRKKYEKITDGEVRFTQTVKFSMARIEQEVTGTLLFKKNHKYRVEFDDQLIVTDGSTVWSYSRSTNQVLIDNFRMDERTISPEQILSGAPSAYAPTLVGKEQLGKVETTVLKLSPPEGTSLIKSMKVWVQEGEWLVRRAEIIDRHGKETTYQVHSFTINTGIPDDRFRYTPPEGVETVDLR